MSSLAIHALALVAYLGAAVLYGANLALRGNRHALIARGLFLAAIVLHTVGIGAFCVQTRESPFASSFGTLSVAGWIIALLYVPMEFLARVPAVGALAAPITCLLLFAGLLRSHRGLSLSPDIKSQVISVHVLMVLVSFGLFALAACCAVFYLWQYGALKHPDRRGLFRRLPPLETVDSAAYHLVAFALPLLTLGLALGIERAAHGALKGNWLTDPHTLVSFVTWMVYCAYILARTVAGWRGTRLNYLLIAGLAVTLALFFIPTTTHKFT